MNNLLNHRSSTNWRHLSRKNAELRLYPPHVKFLVPPLNLIPVLHAALARCTRFKISGGSTYRAEHLIESGNILPGTAEFIPTLLHVAPVRLLRTRLLTQLMAGNTHNPTAHKHTHNPYTHARAHASTLVHVPF